LIQHNGDVSPQSYNTYVFIQIFKLEHAQMLHSGWFHTWSF